jgi:hypothetical protein
MPVQAVLRRGDGELKALWQPLTPHDNHYPFLKTTFDFPIVTAIFDSPSANLADQIRM